MYNAIFNHNKIFVWLLYGFSAAFLLFSIFNFYYSNKILPGVYLNNESFSGLNKEQALTEIKKIVESQPKKIVINYSVDPTKSDERFEISTEDIELQYLIEDTYTELFGVNREKFYSPLFAIVGYFKPIHNSSLHYSLNEEVLDISLANISAIISPQNRNAHFIYEDSLVIRDASPGMEVDVTKLKRDIKNGISNGELTFNAKAQEFSPNLYTEDLEAVKPGVEGFLNSNLNFTYNNINISPEPVEKLAFLRFEKNEGLVEIRPDSAGINSFVKFAASRVNIDPKGSTLEVGNNGEVAFEPPVVGLALNEKELREDIVNYVNDYDFESAQNSSNEIALNVEEHTPEKDSNEYGIKELIAEGVSHFRGSSVNRISNIATASEKIKGTLVAPGETFSFNEAVGPITIDSGFNQAYIISKGRTTLGTGGGVCQVSTTVFRAALNSGLPIVDRTAHAYRVSYYEQNSPVGYDATIYQPSVDFVFENDMENHILVYTEVNTVNNILKVKIYGTKDGREVTVTEPEMVSEIPPPEAVYIDDESLPEGTVIQEEYPAWGGTVVFERIVKKDGETLYKDEFKSYYTPWAAVYKRGV